MISIAPLSIATSKTTARPLHSKAAARELSLAQEIPKDVQILQTKVAIEFSEYLLNLDDSCDPCDCIHFLYNHPEGPLDTFAAFNKMYGDTRFDICDMEYDTEESDKEYILAKTVFREIKRRVGL